MTGMREHDVVELVVSADTLEESQRAYSEWAKNYDKDLAALERKSPEIIVKILMGLTSVEGSRQQRILDVGAGTGAIAEELVKQGFHGKIDAVDGNKELLEEAKSKNIYTRVIEQLLLPDSDINADKNSYDFVTCIGALFPNHIPYQIVGKMVSCLKQSGFVIYSLWGSEKITEFKEQLEIEMQRLVDGNIVRLHSQTDYTHFDNLDVRASEASAKQTLFCYQKL